jgi:glycolate dehydrogenase FAD-linked subunit
MLMNRDEIKKELIRILGKNKVFTDKAHLLCYRFGNVVEYRLNPPDFLADFVVRPDSTDQVSLIVKLANGYGFPVIAWGGGTDFTGANSPIKGGIVIDMKGLNRIEVDKEESHITAGAGATLLSITEEAEKNGLLFPYEITSQPSATLGGAMATNALGFMSGDCRYIRNVIMGIEAVLPTGEVIRTKPLYKTSVGYDLNSMFIGSEGTLGIVTEATLMLISKPESRVISTFLLPNFEEANKVAVEIYRLLHPEFFDLLELSFIKYLPPKSGLSELFGVTLPGDFLDRNTYGGYPVILTIGFEGIEGVVEAKCTKLEGLIRGRGIKIENDYYAKRFIKYHEGFKNVLDLIPVSLEEYTYATFDISLPLGKITEMRNVVYRILNENYEVYLLSIDLYSNPTVMAMDFLVPLKNKSTYFELFKQIYGNTFELGGAISAADGIGVRLQCLTESDLGKECVAVMNKIKKALDPNKTLNPGKLGDFH